MKGETKARYSRRLRTVLLAITCASLLITPDVIAGHLDTSPAVLSLKTNPVTPDQTAIRGLSERDSLGPDDIPVGVTGRATGSALGDDSRVIAVRGEAMGDAAGNNARILGLLAVASGNATGAGARIRAASASAIGTATGPGSRIEGLVASAEGSASGSNTSLRGVVGNAEGSAATVDGVRGNATATSGTAFGLRGIAEATSGSAAGVFATATANGPNAWGVLGIAFSPQGTGVAGVSEAASGFTTGVFGESQSPNGTGVQGRNPSTSGTTIGVRGESNSPSGRAIVGVGNNGAKAGEFFGRVDITCSPPPCLVVNGFGIADLAEDLPVIGKVGPGDVVVLATGGSYGIARASRPYDTKVAGIVSVGARVRFANTQGKTTAPVAMVGVVRAKATAINGSIAPGDLLTTSRIPGHLMRCPAALRCVGAIVGKAMEPLAKGERQILVLLWRQ